MVSYIQLSLSVPPLNVTLSLARLTINVLDVNDNAPRFRPFGVTNFTEKILEGAQPGTTLLSVSAVDPDKGPNGQVTYELLHLPRGGYVRLEDPSTGTTTITTPQAALGCRFIININEKTVKIHSKSLIQAILKISTVNFHK